MRIGVDLGGTKIEAAALDGSGRVVARHRLPTPASNYEEIIGTIAELVERLESVLGVAESVGIGHPGSNSPATGLIKNSNSTVLLGRALDRDLEAALARPVRLANDANCFALSEAVDGAAAGRSPVFGTILGTGVGGGVVVDGRLVGGPNAIAGEWGHNPLPPNAADPVAQLECYCGKSGCIEKYLSGPGLAADHARATGDHVDPPGIVRAALRGEAGAAASMERYIERLAAGLAVVINILDPEVIVLGGGLSNIDALYNEVPGRLGDYVFSDRVDTQIVKNLHGDSSGVRGAAWLWHG